MIPVYSRNRAYAIFFIAFTLIGELGRVTWGKGLGVFPSPVTSPPHDSVRPPVPQCLLGRPGGAPIYT